MTTAVNSFPLPKQYRLNDSVVFKSLLSSAPVSLRDNKFTILASPSSSPGRIGIIASKKRFPTAVERNLLKRRVRETYRLMRSSISSLDLVIVIKSNNWSGEADLAPRFSRILSKSIKKLEEAV